VTGAIGLQFFHFENGEKLVRAELEKSVAFAAVHLFELKDILVKRDRLFDVVDLYRDVVAAVNVHAHLRSLAQIGGRQTPQRLTGAGTATFAANTDTDAGVGWIFAAVMQLPFGAGAVAEAGINAVERAAQTLRFALGESADSRPDEIHA
jgi:hypothetical protein